MEIYRTTKCLGSNKTSECKGSFPRGFLKWVKKMDWWNDKRCYLCSGMVDDPNSIRVDVRPETNPTHLEDAVKTSIPSKSVNWVMIDPPYRRELAKEFYGTEKYYHGINVFTKEARRICESGGLILTLSYEIPKRIPNCSFISVVGIYTVPMTGYMRCFTVSKQG